MDSGCSRKEHNSKQRGRIDHQARQDIMSGQVTERTFFREVRASRVEFMRKMAEQHKPLFPESR